ncbi:hypothetical protein [Microbulbifer litoralis]|uniref:hypothetical protein n=1 Tax=Microbulbifer litoralis TaxID=2933965 RepID=UPI0020290D95|nr:hypothetical protein [Microbulbifer sp. GX H0434]
MKTLLSIIAIATTAFLLSSTASAQVLDVVTCTGSSTVTYDPAVTNTSELHTVEFTVEATSCPGYEGKVPGNYTFTAQAEFSCTDLYAIPQHTNTFNWADGSYTDVQWNLTTVTRVNGNVNITSAGTVTGGFGLSSLPGVLDTTAVSTVLHPELNLTACAGSGVSQSSGTSLLTLTGTF